MKSLGISKRLATEISLLALSVIMFLGMIAADLRPQAPEASPMGRAPASAPSAPVAR